VINSVEAYLVQITTPQSLNQIVTLLLFETALFSENLSEDVVDLTSHAGSISTDIEVSTLLDELVDLLRVLGKSVLNVDLLVTVTRESSNKLESVSKLLLVFLFSLLAYVVTAEN
jgi:hypothetical protein